MTRNVVNCQLLWYTWFSLVEEYSSMKIYDKLLRPITAVNYLRAENVERYRVIVRYFYQKHENINYWLHREDIYEMMREIELFRDYTLEKCQSDLDSLVEWGNLVAIQDSAKVKTIEDFKNKKYRYQLSDYSIQIERMTLIIENLEVETSSLEPTLLERIRSQILSLGSLDSKTDGEVASWWRDVSNDFVLLNHNYQDYIKTLNSAKAEEMLKSREFLIFKDHLIVYLRTFVKNLQEQSTLIQEYLSNIDQNSIINVFEKIVRYEESIPRIDTMFNPEELYFSLEGKWQSIYNWFVGENGFSEVHRLYDITNEIIQRITRYAQQIGEMHSLGANRKEEYRNISRIFKMCHSLNEAHELSALVFGVDTCFNLRGLDTRITESIDGLVYQEPMTVLALESRSRYKNRKIERVAGTNYDMEEMMNREELLKEKEVMNQLIEKYTKQKVVDFSKLDVIGKEERKLLLSWLSRAMANKSRRSKCENGLYYSINETNKDKECIVQCQDGSFKMPCYTIHFEVKDESC